MHCTWHSGIDHYEETHFLRHSWYTVADPETQEPQAVEVQESPSFAQTANSEDSRARNCAGRKAAAGAEEEEAQDGMSPGIPVQQNRMADNWTSRI